MKKILTIVVAIAAITLCGCRSKKEAVPAPAQQPEPLTVVEEDTWHNVYAPVNIDLIRPVQFSASGRMTMVRGESVYLSVRMFGMEMASAFATPNQAVLAMKAPKKLMMEVPLTEILARAGLNLTDVQEALLGNTEALEKLPKNVSYDAQVSDNYATVEFHTTYSGKDLAVRLRWDLKSAKWNQKEVNEWKAPGNGYTKVTPAEALKMAGSMLK